MKKVAIAGYYGFDNIGDEAILYCLINALRMRISDDITVLSANPIFTERKYTVKAINRYNAFQIINTLRKNNIFILGGGGLLQDITSKRSLVYYLSLVLLSKILRNKVVLLAIGVGPLKSNISKILTKFVLNKVDLITTRDNESKELLQKIGVKKKIYETADLAFLLNAQCKMHNAKYEIPYKIGISLRAWPTLNLTKIAFLLDDINEKICFLPFHHNDINIAYKLKDRLNNKHYLEIIENKLEVTKLFSFISQFDIIIGMRYHSIILSAIHRVPFLAINYDNKVEYLVTSLEMQDYLINPDEDEALLINKFNKIRETKVEIEAKLGERVEELYNKALHNLELVAQIGAG